MKSISMVAVIAITLAASLFAQTKIRVSNEDNLVKETLINLEKRAWQARKDKDDKHLYILTTKDAINVGEFGVANQSAILKSVARPKCEIKGYKIEDVSVTIFNANTALLTYKAEQERVCESVVALSSIWASSVYLKQNGKWLNAFYQETPANQPK